MIKFLNLILFSWALVASIYCYKLNSKLKVQSLAEHASAKMSSCSADSEIKDQTINLQVSKLKDESTLNENSSKAVAAHEEKDSSNETQKNTMLEYRINARLSAIEKFVPLDENQKERLREKFKAELNNQPALSLEDVIGKESADFYRSEVQKAYEKSHNEQVDKEVFYLSRILNLSQEQELKVRQVVSDVKGSTDFISHKPEAGNSISSLQNMLDAVKVQNDLLTEKMKAVLNDQQYQSFLQYQGSSSDSDFTLLHTDPS